MIKGIGTDIVEIERIEDCINNHGDHFLKKVFTVAEIEYCRNKRRPAVHFAGRWAAKEAFFKALPPECQSVASWTDVQVVASKHGGPFFDICSRKLSARVRKSSIARFHLSISHERVFCIAFVVAV
jgi:holo-[acyl-carrier protein] synthase